jgi:hypothetical protein
MNRLTYFGIRVLLVCTLLARSAAAQNLPVVMLEVQVENVVVYATDLADPGRFATEPNATTAATRTFGTSLLIGDIVAVNGKPARGSAMINQRTVNLRNIPTPGQAFSDVVRNAISDYALEILQPNGVSIGSIYANGFSGGPPPPGAPVGVTGSNNAVVGGTGAFLGARGQLGAGVTTVTNRIASVAEDPNNRRTNGGGKFSILVHLVEVPRPEITLDANGPAVVHGIGFTRVTTANPATAGETLILYANRLGPTSPGVDLGRPFPNPGPIVNSPVEVTMNGVPAQVLYAGGFPGSIDGYHVSFRVPSGIASGEVTLQLTVGFIPGPTVKIVLR